MSRAAAVKGVCRVSGKPARDFTVYFWHEDVSDGGKLVVNDSEDGTFTVEEAAPGLVQLMASCTQVVQTPLVTLQVAAGASGQAVLEFSDSVSVSGRVVDAVTGEPVTTARATLLLTNGSGWLGPWSSPRCVDEQGRFQVTGLGAGHGGLLVEADGYATRKAELWGAPPKPCDAGRIALHRAENLTVRLHVGPDVDIKIYGVSLRSATKYISEQRVAEDGIARFQGLTPGNVQIWVIAPDGSVVERAVRVRPGVVNSVDIDLSGRTLDVQVVPANGARLPEDGSVSIVYADVNGIRHAMTRLMTSQGSVRFLIPETERVVVTVCDGSDKSLMMRTVTLGRRGAQSVTLEVGSSAQRIRMITSDGAPAAGSSVFVRPVDQSLACGSLYTADAAGFVEILNPDSGEFLLSAQHPNFAPLPCTRFSTKDARSGTIDIVLPAGMPVDLNLKDGAAAIASVELDLEDTCGAELGLGSQLSDVDGRVHIAHLAPGNYRVVVEQPGIWPLRQLISVSPTTTTFTIQLRRLGSARVRVSSGAGNPLAGRSVELTDVLTGTRVSDWTASGDVPAPAGGFATDAKGELLVHALPHGTYRCVVQGSGGESIERMLEVPPYATGETEIRVP